MSRLNPSKLHVRFLSEKESEEVLPRRYTLTHSDRTGALYLTIGPDYDFDQIKGWYTRLMRDEVLAELLQDENGYKLHVYCEVKRGFGTRKFRERIFRRELPLVLEAISYGDRELFSNESQFSEADVMIHFCDKDPKHNRIENWGPITKYSKS